MIDNYKEMMKIKEQCLMHDKQGRMILPYFFSFSHKLKGYFDGEKKNYKHHDTAMDYLEEVLDEHRFLAKRQKTLRFADMLYFEDYSSSRVQYRKLQEMIDLIKKTQSEMIQFESNSHIDIWHKKFLYYALVKSSVEKMNELKLNEDTLFWFLKNVENEDFSSIKTILLLFLFNSADSSLYNLIKKSKHHLPAIFEDFNGKIEIFGKKYAKN